MREVPEGQHGEDVRQDGNGEDEGARADGVGARTPDASVALGRDKEGRCGRRGPRVVLAAHGDQPVRGADDVARLPVLLTPAAVAVLPGEYQTHAPLGHPAHFGGLFPGVE